MRVATAQTQVPVMRTASFVLRMTSVWGCTPASSVFAQVAVCVSGEVMLVAGAHCATQAITVLIAVPIAIQRCALSAMELLGWNAMRTTALVCVQRIGEQGTSSLSRLFVEHVRKDGMGCRATRRVSAVDTARAHR